MKHKVIVADDSLTIQKVIKITLAKEDFELIECLDDQKLHELCKEIKPTLVLLDFNLSESKTGYDLCQEIKNSDVDKILMLYGTFDTVDENLLDHCGANGHIVKPFEGNKFVSLCRQLIEDANSADNDEIESAHLAVPKVKTKASSEINLDDQWVMNQPEKRKHTEDKTDEHDMSDFIESRSGDDQQQVDALDWGVDIPGVINAANQVSAELPPIIGSSDANFNDEVELELETSLPQDDELEYPNVEAIRSSVQAEPAPKAKLTPLEDLKESVTPIEIGLEDTLGTKTDDEIRALEEQIANETAEDLWAVDDDEDFDFDDKVEEEIEPKAEVEVPAQNFTASISKEEVLEALEKKIEAIVNERVEAIIEKIAWDVIPDLAENLISKELKNLADSVKN